MLNKIRFAITLVIVVVVVFGVWRLSIGAETSDIREEGVAVEESKESKQKEYPNLYEDDTIKDRAVLSTSDIMGEFYDLSDADIQYTETDNNESCVVVTLGERQIYVFCNEDGYPYKFGLNPEDTFTEDERVFYESIGCEFKEEDGTRYYEGI